MKGKICIQITTFENEGKKTVLKHCIWKFKNIQSVFDMCLRSTWSTPGAHFYFSHCICLRENCVGNFYSEV